MLKAQGIAYQKGPEVDKATRVSEGIRSLLDLVSGMSILAGWETTSEAMHWEEYQLENHSEFLLDEEGGMASNGL